MCDYYFLEIGFSIWSCSFKFSGVRRKIISVFLLFFWSLLSIQIIKYCLKRWIKIVRSKLKIVYDIILLWRNWSKKIIFIKIFVLKLRCTYCKLVNDYFTIFLEIVRRAVYHREINRVRKIIPTNFTVHKNYFLSTQKCITSAHFLFTCQRIYSIEYKSIFQNFHHISRKTSQPSMNFTRKKFYAHPAESCNYFHIRLFFHLLFEINVQRKGNWLSKLRDSLLQLHIMFPPMFFELRLFYNTRINL